MVIPYSSRGLSKELRRVYRDMGLACTPSQSTCKGRFGSCLRTHSNQMKKCGLVYSVKSETCNVEHVGETGRLLSTRMKEHKSSVLNKNMKSAMEEHVLKKPGYKFFYFNSVKIIDSGNNEKMEKLV